MFYTFSDASPEINHQTLSLLSSTCWLLPEASKVAV